MHSLSFTSLKISIMFSFKNQSPLIQSDVEKVYNAYRNSAVPTDPLPENINEVTNRLAGFFNCRPEEAIPLACLLQLHISEERTSVGNLLDHFMAKKSHASYINKLLSVFVERDWVSPKRDISIYPLTEYSINLKLIRCVLSGEMKMNEEEEITNSFELLQRYKRLMNKRREGRIDYQPFIQSVHELLKRNSQIDLARLIIEWGLTASEASQFMYFCMRYYLFLNDPSTDDMIKDLNPPREEQYRLRSDFKYGSHALFREGLIKQNTDSDFPGFSQYMLTPKAIRAFDNGSSIHYHPEGRLLKALVPEAIPEKKLVFDKPNQKRIEQLHRIFETEPFTRLQARLTEQGMNPGITILLYGSPGTGKTESVLQLARQSGRHIFLAEPNRIRSKWVGETEKNIKELFDEYHRHVSQYESAPILLFNEADAIMGKRMAVKDRGDQMENAMQNIILQELEQFEGIFIATTNLEGHLDGAFDRRFLYKIKFDNPGKETMLGIWKTKFPGVSKRVLRNICEQFTLSGGQIENIRKKASVDLVLNERLRITENYLITRVREELKMRGDEERPRIGFR